MCMQPTAKWPKTWDITRNRNKRNKETMQPFQTGPRIQRFKITTLYLLFIQSQAQPRTAGTRSPHRSGQRWQGRHSERKRFMVIMWKGNVLLVSCYFIMCSSKAVLVRFRCFLTHETQLISRFLHCNTFQYQATQHQNNIHCTPINRAYLLSLRTHAYFACKGQNWSIYVILKEPKQLQDHTARGQRWQRHLVIYI